MRTRAALAGLVALACAAGLSAAGSDDAASAAAKRASLIVFVSSPDPMTHDITVMTAGGKRRTNLTTDVDTSETSPALSPDGTKIAFRSTREGTGDIFVMGVDGSNPVNLTHASTEEDNESPSFSPDGKRIVFASSAYTDPGARGVYVMRIDGSHLHKLTPSDGYEPVYSPDGHRIAFQRGNDVWIMHADGSHQRNLTGPAFDGYVPSFSPDGKRIVYASHTAAGDLDVFVMTSRGRILHDLTARSRKHDVSPSYLPDGERIVYTGGVTGDIYVMRADGTKVRNLTETPDIGEYDSAAQPG